MGVTCRSYNKQHALTSPYGESLQFGVRAVPLPLPAPCLPSPLQRRSPGGTSCPPILKFPWLLPLPRGCSQCRCFREVRSCSASQHSPEQSPPGRRPLPLLLHPHLW